MVEDEGISCGQDQATILTFASKDRGKPLGPIALYMATKIVVHIVDVTAGFLKEMTMYMHLKRSRQVLGRNRIELLLKKQNER